MRPSGPGAPRGGLAEHGAPHIDPFSAVAGFVSKMLTVAELDVRKIRHEPIELLTRAVQPVLWLVVFGQVFTRTRAIPTGNLPYIAFLTPGVLDILSSLSPVAKDSDGS